MPCECLTAEARRESPMREYLLSSLQHASPVFARKANGASSLDRSLQLWTGCADCRMLPFQGVIEQVQFGIRSMIESVGERVTGSGYRLRELQS